MADLTLFMTENLKLGNRCTPSLKVSNDGVRYISFLIILIITSFPPLL